MVKKLLDQQVGGHGQPFIKLTSVKAADLRLSPRLHSAPDRPTKSYSLTDPRAERRTDPSASRASIPRADTLSKPPSRSVEYIDKMFRNIQCVSTRSRANMVKKLGSWLKKNFRGIGEVLIASIEPVPVAGPPIAAALKTLLLVTPNEDPLDTVNSNLKALTFKLDTFHTELKWAAWAAGAYQMPVNNIEKAWIKYTELVRANTGKEALKTDFFTFYSQYADSTLVLHQFLTAKSPSVTQNLGDLLADRLRCHEKDIKAQFLYLNKLMCKGNMINEKFYEFKGKDNNARIDTGHKIASESASALITSHKRCISDSAAYIEKDIFERIDDTKKHQEIADNIRAFLVNTYDRYDWMVVAFTTRNSKHKPKLLKRHALSGFTEVQRGTVTVAVAKQVKGAHTKTAAVIAAIKGCLAQGVKMCLDVRQKLMECQKTVFGKSLSQTYTAVHAYKKSSHTSTNTVEAPNDEDSELPESSVSLKGQLSLTPHLYTGKLDPCSKKKCSQNGKCVVVPGTLIAMCECKYPYYGEHCEMTLETYNRQLRQDTDGRTQTPELRRKDCAMISNNFKQCVCTCKIQKINNVS
uniref:EGF-like domain-containing protein n=1 Tax=Dicentrarchus labrax TaxID=13489 RepID=A0A8C4HM38_DICLA